MASVRVSSDAGPSSISGRRRKIGRPSGSSTASSTWKSHASSRRCFDEEERHKPVAIVVPRSAAYHHFRLIGISRDRTELALTQLDDDRLPAHRVAAPDKRRVSLVRLDLTSLAQIPAPARSDQDHSRVALGRERKPAGRREDGRDRRRVRLDRAFLSRSLTLDSESVLLLWSRKLALGCEHAEDVALGDAVLDDLLFVATRRAEQLGEDQLLVLVADGGRTRSGEHRLGHEIPSKGCWSTTAALRVRLPPFFVSCRPSATSVA